ncbi:serine/threonine kinase [Streptomyces tsukubensis]|uniref:PASTA domain-containing protein n=2 Tax=Streptomyces tsukubensis TaxID=83656 RepID=A0A1V4A8N4_9ACTN|nr:hypothetical protein B1H18_16625 [Streptomyces tsukubensis]QFR95168.1 serine/threonine kinase [Streptomyces tsukubensis]
MVPRFVGLMAVDLPPKASVCGVRLVTPDRPDPSGLVVEYAVRQYPPPGTGVPRGSVVTVWFDRAPGDPEGGSGVREPRRPGPEGGGPRRELPEPPEPEPVTLTGG